VESRIEIQVPNGVCRVRLEDFLLDHFGGLSKMYLRDVVKGEACQVNGRIENVGYRLRTNDLIEILVDETRETAMRPENIPLDVVFEDDWTIVVNKPAGMLTHPSHRENTGTLLNALAFHCNRDNARQIRPGLPHRLDKQTSGLIVVAKTPLAHRRLSASFMKKRVAKRYLALVEGVIKKDEGTIEAPIGRCAEIKHWSVKSDGKHSVTRYWVKERYADTTLIELEPVTGRTNQLRIHCESIGHPIVGDTKRGGREFHCLCLHAWNLAFPHPRTNESVSFESPVAFDQEILMTTVTVSGPSA
jgi:23S rRNA pseudouridine1911/1915/1917 synthase